MQSIPSEILTAVTARALGRQVIPFFLSPQDLSHFRAVTMAINATGPEVAWTHWLCARLPLEKSEMKNKQ